MEQRNCLDGHIPVDSPKKHEKIPCQHVNIVRGLDVKLLCFISFMMTSLDSQSLASDSLLAAWGRARVAAVSPDEEAHSIHSYFNVCPESPDGRWVLFYRSVTPEAHEGEIVIRERATGEEKVLARPVVVEDAHRVACQQWVCNGREVVFHNCREGQWTVEAVDIETLRRRILARGRQVGWGQPTGEVVPLYGPHFAPGDHRGLEILNVTTGGIEAIFSAEDVRRAYPDMVERHFGSKPVSVFFPILSPDLQRVIFKMATPGGGDFRSKQASIRHLLLAYHLGDRRFLFAHEAWGHPAWHPDARALINVRSVLIDTDDGSVRELPGLPYFPGTHPTVSPDGRLFLTDTRAEPFGGAEGEWGIALGPIEGGRFEVIHRFDHSRGAASWRLSHPHPAFNHDGRRIYFNVSSGGWTRLFVAERGDPVGHDPVPD